MCDEAGQRTLREGSNKVPERREVGISSSARQIEPLHHHSLPELANRTQSWERSAREMPEQLEPEKPVGEW